MPGQAHRHPGAESWLGKSEQRDKWNFCLTAAKIAANQEQNHVKTTAPEPHPGFQGQGGFSRREGGQTPIGYLRRLQCQLLALRSGAAARTKSTAPRDVACAWRAIEASKDPGLPRSARREAGRPGLR